MGLVRRSDTWQLQDAKAKFSEVIKSAAGTPQIITGEEPNLIEAFKNAPWPDVELEEMPREPFEMRDIDL
ncbi:hypothetical protein AGMMS49942_08360 [Spirochaetia bacterium]|nr:hypothetical protein AGMMS49942_08360 [Spirochaetia bacterium]